MRTVSMMLKAIHSQESKAAAREKAALVAEELRELKLTAEVEESIEETLTYMDYPSDTGIEPEPIIPRNESIGKSSAVQRRLELFQIARAL